MIHRSTHRFAGAMVVLVASSVTLVVASVYAATSTPPPEISVQDLASRALLLRMADFLARTPAISVTMRSDYDAIQADGQRIEFGEHRRILVQRPDKMRVEVERSDGPSASTACTTTAAPSSRRARW